MPRPAELDEALNKGGGLTLSQLANYDDIITDTLVDRVRRGHNVFPAISILTENAARYITGPRSAS